MKKVIKLVLMLCLVLSGAFGYAHGAARTEMKGDGTPIEVIEASTHGSSDKSASINAYIDSHTLTVVFTENLGQVAVEITTDSGSLVETFWLYTPNGLLTNLPLTGDYIITFTLPNGDEYYGEFTVTD